MATVDFTLDDVEVRVRKVVKQVVRLELVEAEARIKQESIDYIRTVNGELRDELVGEIGELRTEMIGEFQKQNEKIDGFGREMKSVKQVVNQHSVDIAELRAKTA